MFVFTIATVALVLGTPRAETAFVDSPVSVSRGPYVIGPIRPDLATVTAANGLAEGLIRDNTKTAVHLDRCAILRPFRLGETRHNSASIHPRAPPLPLPILAIVSLFKIFLREDTHAGSIQNI